MDADYRTKQPHIYAVGDVIGFPSLASVSMEQGRIAAAHAFGKTIHSNPENYPYGIYTIPGDFLHRQDGRAIDGRGCSV